MINLYGTTFAGRCTIYEYFLIPNLLHFIMSVVVHCVCLPESVPEL